MTVATLTYGRQTAPWDAPLSMGVQAFVEYNGLVMNDRHQADRIRIFNITGLDDPDSSDSREVVPGDDDEFVYDGYYRGRTLVVTGRIEAGSLGVLKRLERDFKAAFGPLVESPMKFKWFDIYDGFNDPDTLQNYTVQTLGSLVKVKSGVAQLLTTPAYRQMVTNDAPISYWRLDESGNHRVAVDQMGKGPVNPIPNPGFESDTAGWAGFVSSGAFTLTQVPSDSRYGSGCGEIDVSGTPGFFQVLQGGGPPPVNEMLAVTPGQTISGLGSFKVVSGTLVNTHLAARCFDANGNLIAQPSIGSSIANPTNGSWIDLSGTVVVPANVAYVAIQLSSNVTGATAVVRVDGFMLAATSTVPAYSKGNNGNEGDYIGSFTLGQPGALSGSGDSDAAVLLDGASGAVRVPYSTTIPTTPFSVEAWINPALGGVNGPTIAMFSSGWPNNGWWLKTNSANTSLTISTMNGSESSLTATGVISRGSWYHVVATYDGAIATLYVNGVQVARGTLPAPAAVANTGRLTFGAFDAGGGGSVGDWLGGVFDEPALYNYALSSVQVVERYQAGVFPSKVIFTRSADNRLWGDAQTTIRIIVGSATDNSSVCVIPTFKDPANYLQVSYNANSGSPTVTVSTVVAGVSHQLASASVSGIVQGQPIWLRGKREGDLVTAELWTTPPTESTVPPFSAPAWLSGSDADLFGDQVLSQVGFGAQPYDQNWAVDDFKISSLCPSDVVLYVKKMPNGLSIRDSQDSPTTFKRNFQLTLRASKYQVLCATQTRSQVLVPTSSALPQLGFTAPLKAPLVARSFVPSTVQQANNILSINNRGTARTRPVIVFYGATSPFSIVNLTNEQQISWSGTLLDGDYLVFDCAARKLVNSVGANMLRYFSSSSRAWMWLEPGWNDIYVAGSSYSGSTKFLLYMRSAWM